MADKIQLTLENMIPELEYFVENGIFTKIEVKKIIKKRRYYEYQFEKKDVSKLEFFKAIKYEKVLERRRIAKRKELQMKMNRYNDYHCKLFFI
jgi:U3 small nucleolar RNA-associated protein 6